MKKHKKRTVHHASAHPARRSALHRPVPMLAVLATLVLVILGLGIWLQSVVVAGGM